ncbi:hypothetical protein ACSQ67_025683 [Phaseolus vulgaris]
MREKQVSISIWCELDGEIGDHWRQTKFFVRTGTLEFDGASKGNPGKSDVGAVVRAIDGSLILGWQQTTGKVVMQRCAASVQWLNQRIALSRYAHVSISIFSSISEGKLSKK